MPRLIRVEENEETVFEVDESILTIGRTSSNHVQVGDPSASREHCQIMQSAGGWVLEDLDSTHGTRVNGDEVQMSRLSSGDRIEIGDTVIHWMERADAEEPGAGEEGDGTAAAGPGEDREEEGRARKKARREARKKARKKASARRKARAEKAGDGDIVPGYLVQAVEGPAEGTRKSSRADARLVIGSGSDADLILADDAVAGAHAEIFRGSSGFLLVTGPECTVEVDGEERSGRASLEKGSRIRIGESVLEFRTVKLRVSGRQKARRPGKEGSSKEAASGRSAAPPGEPGAEETPSSAAVGADDADDIPVAAPAEDDLDIGTDLAEVDYEKAMARARTARLVSTAVLVVLGGGFLFFGFRFIAGRLGPVEGDPEPTGNRVRQNWSFEEGVDGAVPGWEIPEGARTVADRAAGGRRALRVPAGDGPGVVRSADAIELGERGKEVQVRASVLPGSGGRVLLRIRWEGSGTSLVDVAAVAEPGGTWRDVSGRLEPPIGATGFRIEAVATRGEPVVDRMQAYVRDARDHEPIRTAKLEGSVRGHRRVRVRRLTPDGPRIAFDRLAPWVGAPDASVLEPGPGPDRPVGIVDGSGRSLPFDVRVEQAGEDLVCRVGLGGELDPGTPVGLSLVAPDLDRLGPVRVIGDEEVRELRAGFDPTPASEVVWGPEGSQVALRLPSPGTVASEPGLGGHRLSLELTAADLRRAGGRAWFDLLVATTSSRVRAEVDRLLEAARSAEEEGDIGEAIRAWRDLRASTYPPEVQEQARTAVGRLEAEARELLAATEAVVEDYRDLPTRPIWEVLQERLAACRQRLAGWTSRDLDRLLREAGQLEAPSRGDLARSGGISASDLLRRGNELMADELFRLAAACFEELIRRHPDDELVERARGRLEAARARIPEAEGDG